jgi:LmbE family N-acetylglucosaminyl deacetylase
MKKVMVVAVHPDDETLGAGGTLLRLKDQGVELHWLIVTTLLKSDSYYDTREQEIAQVSKAYGFSGVHRFDLPTTKLDEISKGELIGKFAQVLDLIRPDTLILPFAKDVHTDHQRSFEAAFSAVKSFRRPFVQRLYMMETLSETDYAPALTENAFLPNFFVDITDYIERKCEIAQIYANEIAPPPFPRSLENLRALARYRGGSSYLNFAESFVLLKEVLK